MNEQLEKLFLKSVGQIKRNSPTILTFVGVAGVITTSILSVKSTPKALELLEKAETEKGEELTKIEKVKVAGKCYIPAVIVGVSTIACIFGANILNKKSQASLASAYALIENSYREYRKKVEELYGDGTDCNIRNSIAIDKRKVHEEQNDKMEEYDSDDKVTFFDEFSGRFFDKTMAEVIQAEYDLNKKFISSGEATINDFYKLLGLAPISGGDNIGWSQYAGNAFYKYAWVDFVHFFVEAEDKDDPDYHEFYRIATPFLPTSDYDIME